MHRSIHRAAAAGRIAALVLGLGVFAACAAPAEKAEPELVTEEVVVPEVDLSEDVTEQGPVAIDPDSLQPAEGQGTEKRPSGTRDGDGQKPL